MKRYSFYLTAFIWCAFSCACRKDFLEKPDKTQLIRQAYVTDLKTTGDYLNGIYVNLGILFYTGSYTVYPDLIADNVKPIRTDFTIHYNWQQLAGNERASGGINPRDPNCNGQWAAGYRIIRDCNFVIETIDRYRNEDPAKADDIKGQALGMRALIHHELLRIFAQPFNFTADGAHPGIPYITWTELDRAVSRQSVAEVHQGIVSDLEAALTFLPAQSASATVFNPNAARSLLARVDLFRGEYAKAIAMARQVIEAVPLMAGPAYPTALFTGEDTEAVFQLMPADANVAAGAGQYYTGFIGQWLVDPFKYYMATADIADLLTEDAGDKRQAWVTSDETGWNITKYPTGAIPGFGMPAASHYVDVLRTTDLCLIAAEAYARLDNRDSAAYYLDAVRLRANPTVPATGATGPDLLDLIYRERRKEFCFEGTRMYDLIQQKQGVTRADAATGAQVLPYPSDMAIAPIPLADVQLSGLSQNPGYSN